MTLWGGGTGGWQHGMGGGGGTRMRRTHDGWDEDFLGKVYDAEVVRRLLPYMKEWKFHAIGFAVPAC